MVDGKVCNAATHTKATMRCYLCGATSSQFNNLQDLKACKKETWNLIARKKWNVRLTAEEKQIVESRKKEIQDKFREQLGLLVDIPKANFGNSNDGNTSRRFFENFAISAEFTGIDMNSIYRLKVILDTLCCG
uniref:SFRICE_028308 n=1 Tax=Spodoptera frugiperda TaxID=7108 RepID=A0A2H1VR95_SPOFR